MVDEVQRDESAGVERDSTRPQGAGLSFRLRGPLAPHPGPEDSQAPGLSSSRPLLLRGWQRELQRPCARKARTELESPPQLPTHTSYAPICTAQNKEERKNLRAITQNSLFLFEMALISNKTPEDKSVKRFQPFFLLPGQKASYIAGRNPTYSHLDLPSARLQRLSNGCSVLRDPGSRAPPAVERSLSRELGNCFLTW